MLLGLEHRPVPGRGQARAAYGQVLDLILADAADTAPPGFRDGFADELRMLVETKRDLFP